MQYRQRKLQRSVTLIRRYVIARPCASSIGSGLGMRGPRGVDPALVARREGLLLPDGRALLGLLDEIAARVERLGPVRTRHRDRDARLAGPDETRAMPQRDARLRPARVGLGDHAVELGLGHLGIGGILDARDVA